MSTEPSPSIEVEPAETSPQFRKIVVDGAMGFVNHIGLRLTLYSENAVYNEILSSIPTTLHKRKLKRTIECELIVSPQTLREIHRFLGEQIEHYEAIYGKIPSSKEIESNRKKYRDLKCDKSQSDLA
jgi:hypothetical protein